MLSTFRREERKQLSDESMLAAFAAIKDGCPVQHTAVEHKSLGPLSGQTSCRISYGMDPGQQTYLTITEETELGGFIQEVGMNHYDKMRTPINGIAESVSRKKGVKELNFIWLVLLIS